MSITIVIPYTPYKVPVGNRTVNLTANARNRRRWPDTDARDRMRSDGFYLGRKAMEFQDDSFEPEEPLYMDVVCRVKQLRKRDDDNLISGLKWLRDGLASALGIDDHSILSRHPRFERSDIEETQITISRTEDSPP